MSGRAVLRDLALKEGTGFRVIFGQIQQCQNGRKVVGAYKAVEDGVVGTYKAVEDTMVDALFRKKGETVEEAKERLRRK